MNEQTLTMDYEDPMKKERKTRGIRIEATFKHPQRQRNRPGPPRHEDDGNLLRIGEILPGVLRGIEGRRQQGSQGPGE